MATSPTQAVTLPEALERPSPSPAQLFEITRAREEALSRLLMAFVTTGLIFMVFPGTFLGVWNLLQISGLESVASISPAWRQAHGHAQVFGWVGSFILGIGFYSIPKMRGGVKSSFAAAWACWAMWTTGAALRWVANVYLWEWRILLPVSALLELTAFLIFFRSVSQHRSEGSDKQKLDPWIWVVISASMGLLLVLLTNLAGCFYVAFARSYAGVSSFVRSTLPRTDGVGIPGAVCLGVQREMDNGLSWTEAAAFEMASRGSGRKSDGTRFDRGRRGLGRIVAVRRRSRHSNRRVRHVRAFRERGEDSRRTFYFPLLRSDGLRMAACGSGAWCRCEPVGHFGWNLGCIASCVNGRICIGNDSERWTAHSASIRGNEDALEHEAHVRGPDVRYAGLHVARLLRSRRVSGLCGVGLVGFADFGALRTRRIDGLRDKYSRDIHSGT